jgi:hypothetical protein
MCLVTDDEATAGVDAERGKLIDFLEERLRIDDNAVADHAGDACVQHAGRDQMQHELLSLDEHRVPGVVAALRAGDDLKAWREQVDDLALALVAPLGAEHDHV